MITSSLAQKYFKLKPSEVLQAGSLRDEQLLSFIVSGVIADTPANSDIPFTFIGSYEDQVASNPYFKGGKDWDEYNSDTTAGSCCPRRCQLLTQPLLPAFMTKYSGPTGARLQSIFCSHYPELHHDSRVNNYNKRQVSYSMLSILGVIGLFLVISACINFINMSTAQAVKRAKGDCVRKSLGVVRAQLIKQFLGERSSSLSYHRFSD